MQLGHGSCGSSGGWDTPSLGRLSAGKVREPFIASIALWRICDLSPLPVISEASRSPACCSPTLPGQYNSDRGGSLAPDPLVGCLLQGSARAAFPGALHGTYDVLGWGTR